MNQPNARDVAGNFRVAHQENVGVMKSSFHPTNWAKSTKSTIAVFARLV